MGRVLPGLRSCLRLEPLLGQLPIVAKRILSIPNTGAQPRNPNHERHCRTYALRVVGAQGRGHSQTAGRAIAARHQASYLAGAYLGSDIQTMPEAICIDTGEVGYGTVPLEKSPLTGGPVRPWVLHVGDRSYRPRNPRTVLRSLPPRVWLESHAAQHTVPWDHLPDFFARVVDDTLEYFGPGERPLAYVFGWIAHIVSDSLIKSVQPGLDLELLDGKYTTAQPADPGFLMMFHELGVQELKLDWPAMFADLAATPVEPVQLHYMRIAEPRGQLAMDFPHGWQPDQRELLNAVLVENRRWCRQHASDVLDNMRLVPSADGTPDCNAATCSLTGTLLPSDGRAGRESGTCVRACWQMGEAIADMFAAVARRSHRLAEKPTDDGPNWEAISNGWSR